jgi:hypothetical protein
MTESTYILLTDPTDPRHGTINGYTNHSCRCELCRAANTESVANARNRRVGELPPEEVHGTENGYSNWRCRCSDCREAHAAAARERRASRKGRK